MPSICSRTPYSRNQLPKRNMAVIDEVQKVPGLLDVVHHLIEQYQDLRFLLTGSSARKLKRGGGNLLAGRAFLNYLYPFTHFELEKAGMDIDFNEILTFGLLPKVVSFRSTSSKRKFLEAYVDTYLKEEILEEQVIRDVESFSHFLEIAAQSGGKVINYSKIARDLGINDKTVKSYFSILEDTLVGFLLYPHSTSKRKKYSQNPKYYFFDMGVLRYLQNPDMPQINEGTYEYGNIFQNFLILEIFKTNKYKSIHYSLSYVRTYNDREIDLILEKKGQPSILIEIKSSSYVKNEDVASLNALRDQFPGADCYLLSYDDVAQNIDNVHVLHWKEGLRKLGLY
ncbi:ATP-binding protein [Planctomycetota bacterium]